MNYHIIQVFLFFPSLYKEYKGTKKMKTRKKDKFLSRQFNVTMLLYYIYIYFSYHKDFKVDHFIYLLISFINGIRDWK